MPRLGPQRWYFKSKIIVIILGRNIFKVFGLSNRLTTGMAMRSMGSQGITTNHVFFPNIKTVGGDPSNFVVWCDSDFPAPKSYNMMLDSPCFSCGLLENRIGNNLNYNWEVLGQKQGICDIYARILS